MKYFWSFLSGFTLPTLLAIMVLNLPYEAIGLFFLLIRLGPWLIAFNFIIIIALKYTLKDKYNLWVAFLSLILPVAVFEIYISVSNINNPF